MNNQNSLISVITPVYNHEKFVAETIKSILFQTYQNWEMLIVDDCSTDKSWEIIQEWAKKDSRIKAFRNDKNKGLIPNWKFLIDNSKGEYLAFLEGDDKFCSKNLEEKMKIFKQYPKVGMVYCNFNMINEKGEAILKNYYNKYKIKIYKNKKIKPEEYLLSNIAPFSTYSQIMIKKEVIDKSGYPRSFDETEKMFLPSDWDFNFRISTKNEIYFINQILLRYRKHSNNSSSLTPKVSKQLRMILNNYKKEFKGNKKIQEAIKYMRGKTLYFKIIFYLENCLKKEAWKSFIVYVKRYPYNFFKDLSMSMLLIIRLIIPNKANIFLKYIYFGGFKKLWKKN